MPHFIGLIRFVLAAQHRVNVAGEICLTAAEAAFVRALDFSTAVEGNWRLPEWPAELLRGYPELGRLVEYAKRRAERTLAPQATLQAPTPPSTLSPGEEGRDALRTPRGPVGASAGVTTTRAAECQMSVGTVPLGSAQGDAR